jgi:hypothetical protein
MDTRFKPTKPLGAKMIIKMNDTQSIENVLKSKACEEFVLNNPNVKIYFITSRDGAAKKDPEEEYFSYDTSTKTERGVFLEEISGLKDEDKALIFHIRILREGIDIEGITGIYFTSWTDIIDFLQNFGRAIRLHKVDRDNLHNNIIKFNEYDKMIKPCGWIILPRLNMNDNSMFSDTQEILKELKNNWNYIPNQLTNITSWVTEPEEEPDTDEITKPDHRAKSLFDSDQDFIVEVWDAVEKNEKITLIKNTDVENINLILELFKTY